METYKKLFQLIGIALGNRDAFDAPLSPEEWGSLLAAARKQALVGVLSPALDRLPAEQKAPLRIYARWMLLVEQIQKSYAEQADAARRLSNALAADGIRSCILKGAGAAALYPQPDLRQSGDVDIWVEGSREQTLAYFKARYPVREVVYHHFDAKVFENVPVEVHFMPSWMNSYRLNRRLQDFFAQNAQKQFDNRDEALGFAVPETDFNAVYSLIHIFRHLFFEGIGLRQIMDYHYILLHLGEADRKSVMAQVRSLGLGTFAGALMYVLGEVFGLDEKYMICPPDACRGADFLEEVLRAGNFGKYDERNAHSSGEGLAGRAWRRLARLAGMAEAYPREALSAPGFKVWQYFWRKKNGYL